MCFDYEWQSEEEASRLRGFTDSDWAGCRKARKSLSGGILFGRHCLKTLLSTQSVYALSVAEAEDYAMVEGTTKLDAQACKL